MTLRALVIGAGWAGEGHTTALRAAGVEVVALCGRTPEPARAMAEKLGVEQVRTDWQKALDEFRPDIVALATPAAPHREMAQAAAGMGCHIVCEKPLASNAADARAMLQAVETAGVKHAYGSTSRYAPGVLHARTLLSEGLIGPVHEIESLTHLYMPPGLPYSWVVDLSLGGGMLNNQFSHVLGQALYATGATVQAAAGAARGQPGTARVGPPIHDFRELFRVAAAVPEGQPTEWRAVDADMAYTVMLRLGTPDGHTASALFQASARAVSKHDYLAFYGDLGTLVLTGAVVPDHIEHFDARQGVWADIPVPQHVLNALPQVPDPVQQDWNSLFREFVADVRGDGYCGYPTFSDGYVAAQIIDIARSGQGWMPVSTG